MTSPSPSASPTVTALAPETLETWFREHQDLVVLDVRSAAEFESIHIRGSYNVPLPLLSEHTEELAARLGSRVVLVCHSGARPNKPGSAWAGQASAPRTSSPEGFPRSPRQAATWSAARPAGIWNARSASPQAPLWCWPGRRKVRLTPDPDAGRRDRCGPDLLGRDQHLRHGPGPVGRAVEQGRQGAHPRNGNPATAGGIGQAEPAA
ncbi:conserved hypothetical protein (plasmid) [Arthrobacter sp. Hiyo8]|nr:conserved hypothetical protein [Arthrobacter sp. Hiyo8]